MKLKDIIFTTILVFGLSLVFYNEYQISANTQHISPEYIIPAPKEQVEAVINEFYKQNPEITQVSIKQPCNVKIRAKSVKSTIINIKSQKVIDEIAIYIKKKEGFREHAYKDNTQYSIGYGTKATSPDETITMKEANSRLYKHIKTEILPSMSGVTFQSIEQVFAAIDFSYNLGHNRFRKNIVRKDGAIDCTKMMAYNKVRDKNGNLVYNEGLAQRRLENFLACTAYEIIE